MISRVIFCQEKVYILLRLFVSFELTKPKLIYQIRFTCPIQYYFFGVYVFCLLSSIKQMLDNSIKPL